jgi:cell volume regulation protein A
MACRSLGALLAGSAAAPTDAAAVAVLLRRAGAALPERLLALLEIESGLDDPMSVFLTLLLLRIIVEPDSIGIGAAVMLFLKMLFLKEMGGGTALGLTGGWVLTQALKRLFLEASLALCWCWPADLLCSALLSSSEPAGFSQPTWPGW